MSSGLQILQTPAVWHLCVMDPQLFFNSFPSGQLCVSRDGSIVELGTTPYVEALHMYERLTALAYCGFKDPGF